LTGKVLIVDDEVGLVKGLSHSLTREGYQVKAAHDGEEALRLLANEKFDIVLLDLMLPKVDGLEVCRRSRQQRDTPIIMLTAKGDDIDRIVGLEMGADDYLAKPFNTRELIARIRAVLRRARGSRHREPETIRYDGIEIDASARRAVVRGRPVDLTAKEFDLLYLLAKNPGRVFQREQILDAVWGADFFDTRTVDVCVGRVRKKIEEDPSRPQFVVTRWGVGYSFDPGDGHGS